MALEHSTLRPGLLVSLKTSVCGNVQYQKRTIEEDHVTSTGAKLAVWETERKISDPEEHERATKARRKASGIIRTVCTESAFGLLCPEDKSDALEAAINDARAVANEFNATANLSRIGIYVITGRVAQDDVEAVRAINSEVRDLMESMQDGVKNLDVAKVRAAANKAKGLGQMLSADASEKIKAAIEVARQAARKIAKTGEGVSQEIDLETVRKIEQSRVAFLDLSDDHVEDAAVAPAAAARTIEFAPDEETDEDPAVVHAAYVAGQLADEDIRE